ncbi:MAG: DoxX family membrane protein [Crocinitomicaceae bacterium]
MTEILIIWATPYAYAIIRISLGLLFFFQAYDKIFRIGLSGVVNEVHQGAEKRKIPEGFTRFSIYLSSYVELIGGALLILGLFTLPVLYLFGIHLMLVILGFSVLKGIWDMSHVFPRLVLLVLLLLLPYQLNILSLDHLLF